MRALSRVKKLFTLPSYEQLYEQHARSESELDVVGNGDFEILGKLELSILKEFGLSPQSRLLDFGCGVGRLAQQALPFLESYTGIDISASMIERARKASSARFIVGDGGVLNTLDEKFDVIAAFSVFTHMDLEDVLLHLQCMRRVIAPTGKLVCTHLLLPESEDAKQVFLKCAARPYVERRSQVLSVVTSRDLVETVASMSGWSVQEWVSADDARFDYGGKKPGALGQAIAVMQATDSSEFQ